MKTRIITTAAVVGLLAALTAGDVFAAGQGNGGKDLGASASAGTTTATRPVGSQRRDGTFLSTGTTAKRHGAIQLVQGDILCTNDPVVTTPLFVTTVGAGNKEPMQHSQKQGTFNRETEFASNQSIIVLKKQRLLARVAKYET
jgi:hypothetical protein